MYNIHMATPLFVRSCYTLLGSLLTPEMIAKKAKEFSYQAVALVDEKVLSGAKAFQKACAREGIRPLYGLSFPVEKEGQSVHPFFLAEDDEGYGRLIALSSRLCLSEEPLPPEAVKDYHSHNQLIFPSDQLPVDLSADDSSLLKQLQSLQAFYGGFLVGICDHDQAYNASRDARLRPLLETARIRTVAFSRTYYAEAEDEEAFHTAEAIRDKTTLQDHPGARSNGRHFLSPQELEKLYDHRDLEYGDMLAYRCTVELSQHTALPQYAAPNQASSRDYLVALCKAGLQKRLKGKRDARYEERLKKELQVIIEMDFADYFLIVYDYIRYAKKEGILVGPGRGSAAGSLVAYCLGITEIDPLRYGLIFERFLNPERISMPDIDADFPDDRRDEVIAYVRQKYGEEHVAHIITYGTLKARQVLRDVGRVLEIPLPDIDQLAKLIPSDPRITLEGAYRASPLFAQRVEADPRNRRLYALSRRLEGLPRHESTHAAGIVFSREKLSDVIPLIRIEEDLPSVQYTMEHLEEMGLIKMDFLGLRNLSIIAGICQEIGDEFRLPLIPLDDRKTFASLARGDTLGIFQLESAGMTSLIRRMQPKNFEEIAIAIALYRPGPMVNIPSFLENRAHPETIDYLHPDLRPILEETYGIIVYQEQILSIARKMAGFSYGKADILRKAMSKKKADQLAELHDDFCNGCMARGYSKELSEQVYAYIQRFADYGFNKSHSVAYALVAYQMAYLKSNHPLAFYRSLLDGVIGSEGKTYEVLSEIHKTGIKVLGPDLNASYAHYRIEGGALRMPLSIIKEVGNASVNAILQEREKGVYRSYEDALKRLTALSVGRNVIENLIYAGAFDSFGINRSTLINNLDALLKYVKDVPDGSLFGENFDASPQLILFQENRSETARQERRVFGFYFSVNPIREVKERNGIEAPTLNELLQIRGNASGFAQIERVKEHKTKRGEWMAFLSVSDGEGTFDLTVMPALYAQFRDQLKKGRYLAFEGKIEKEGSCLLRRIRIVE